MRRRVRSIISEDESGLLVSDFLVNRYRFKNAIQWNALLDSGQVVLNDVPAGIHTVLKSGDVLVYEAPESSEPAVDGNIKILYEDEYLVAVAKTGNLPCHPAGCYHENTLLSILKSSLQQETLHLVNRLDRETSGVVVVAKDADTARLLSGQFLSRSVKKFYTVVVEGVFPEKIFAPGWLIKDANSVIRKKRSFVSGNHESPPCADAEWAETRFKLVRYNNGVSLVDVELMTGRMHQIRATLFSLGSPVVGDKIYGVDDNIFLRFINDQLTVDDKQKLRLERQALHARELYLTHPVSKSDLIIKAPIPADMSSLL